MQYDTNKLPDFFSVRNYEQIDYSLEDLEKKKCFAFFDNGFASSVIEPNKRDMKFIWEGFLLFVDQDITLDDIRNGVDLFDARLVALQRTNRFDKFNSEEVRNYIIHKLKNQNIPYEIMSDKKEVSGYPSKTDLWSTRDTSVLIDAMDCTGNGDAYYFKNADFNYRITFDETNLPDFFYSHNGAIVLKGENSVAISRLLCNDNNLQNYLEQVIGEEKVYSLIEGKELNGSKIETIDKKIRSWRV